VLLDVWPAVQRRMMACTGFLLAFTVGFHGFTRPLTAFEVSIIFTFRPPDALL